MSANPIRKHRFPKIDDDVTGAFVAVFTGWGPWVAVCFQCGQKLRGTRSRKAAKDRLHQHQRGIHA